MLGTGIVGLYYQTASSDLLFIGYAYILIAILVNLVILCLVMVEAVKNFARSFWHWVTVGLMLVNIPVMLYYVQFTMLLLDFARITFTNPTSAPITDIHVVGCGGGYLDKLEAGESKTAWVKVLTDCNISIDYLADGQRMNEIVTGYITSNEGRKWEHVIGGGEEQQF